MDKSSPVYENFAKKMEAMKGGPKISRSTMKIGSGMGLAGRVANNEKKITILKNIFKTQREEIGEKITPRVSNLELTLNETSDILNTITEKLSMDMSQRLRDQKKLFDEQRKQNLEDKKENAEKKLEEKKKSKIGTKIGKAVLKPFGNLFDKLLNLAGILGAGLLGTNILKRLDDEDFQQKIKDIYNWTTKNWKAIAIGAGIIGTIFAAGAIKSFILGAKLAFGLLMNPLVLTALGLLLLAYFGNKIGKPIFDANMKTYESTKNQLIEEGYEPGDADFMAQKMLGITPNLVDGQYDGVALNDGFSSDKLFTSNLPGDIGGQSFDGIVLNSITPNPIIDYANTIGAVPFATKGIELRNLIKDSDNDTTFVELEDIDLTSDIRNQIGGVEVNPATGIPDISSMNMSNPYMEEVPELLGFKDIIYS